MPKFVTDETLRQQFGFHPAKTEEVQATHQEVRDVCLALALDLNRIVPEGPEKTVALRKVREAMFYANAAVAIAGE